MNLNFFLFDKKKVGILTASMKWRRKNFYRTKLYLVQPF